jgi:phage protein D/phage baseplate assembly protein gpV
MQDTLVTSAPLIKLDGTAIRSEDADLLFSLRVSRTTGAAAFAELRVDQSSSLADSVKVGTQLSIDATEDDVETSPIFKGEVMTIGIDVSVRQTQLVIGAYDKSYRLGNQTDATSHLSITFGGVIREIAGAAGLTADVDNTVGSIRFEHIQQSGTPHQFLTDLTRAYGCEWLVDDTKLIVRRRDAAGPVAKYLGASSLRSFSARFSGTEQPESVDVLGWDPSEKKGVNSKIERSSVKNGHTVPITRHVSGDFPGKEAVASPISVSTPADAKAVAEGITHRLSAAQLTGRGEVAVNGKLVPGSVIEIGDLDPNWNGKYYLTGVEHLFGRQQSFTTKFTFGPLEPTTLVDLFSHQAPTSRERLTSGITVGTVTDTEDPEGLLRVKVTIPVLRGENESHWARVISSGAGAARGSMSIPEIGDEVAVVFENGDLQRPYVLGGLWNGRDAAPDVGEIIRNGRVMSRSVTSRTGHRMTYKDGDDPEDLGVRIDLSDGKTFLELGETKIEITSQDTPIKVTNGKATVELADNGDITLDGNNITIKAKQDIEISGNNLDVKAKQNLKLEGALGADLKSKGPVKVETTAIAEVKGSLVKIN